MDTPNKQHFVGLVDRHSTALVALLEGSAPIIVTAQAVLGVATGEGVAKYVKVA